MRMPFGKHKGELIEDIPTPYLAWLLRAVNLERWLETAALEEIERRRQSRASRNREGRRRACSGSSGHGSDGATHQLPATFPAALQKCHREMVMRFHPDRGGSHEAMVAINVCFDRLQELLSQAAA